MRVTAAVVRETHGPFVLEELDLDDPRSDEVLVRIIASGICHTDLVVRDGGLPPPPPVVLGHEGAGVVERVGDGVTKIRPGDHVVLTFASCGVCMNCYRARPSYCMQFPRLNLGGSRPDGSPTLRKDEETIQGSFFGQSSFATFALAKERNVVKVSEDVSLEDVGPLGCGIQTGAGGVLNVLRPAPGSTIAIFGTGSVGLSAVLAAQVAACTTIIAVDINTDRLAVARELGATHVINSRDANAVESIKEVTRGAGVDYSIEATGIPLVMRQAVDSLKLLGTCGLIGIPPMGTEVTIDFFTMLSGRSLRGIMEGDSVPDTFIPTLIDLHKQGRFPFDRMIRKYPFAEINRAVDDSLGGQTIKAVVKMS